MDEYVIRFSNSAWASWLTQAVRYFFKPTKIHDYRDFVAGVDYVFETIPGTINQAYMTAQRKKVSPGDHIILMQDEILEKYCVEEITYYACPNDMWIALLVKVDP